LEHKRNKPLAAPKFSTKLWSAERFFLSTFQSLASNFGTLKGFLSFEALKGK
jgi:hypothetical protein